MGKDAEYYSKDFKWEELRQEIETDPSFRFHLMPLEFDDGLGNPSSSQYLSSSQDSEAWNKFHSRHSTGKFFKERRYLLKEFPELLSCDDYSEVLEVGCGNGSTILPILRGKESITVYACDCSLEALKRAEEIIYAADLASAKQRFHAFACDFSVTGFPKWLACGHCREYVPQSHDIGHSGLQMLPWRGEFCYLDIHTISSTCGEDANSSSSMFLCIKTWWPTSVQRLW